MHAHTLHSLSACWRSSEPAKTYRLTKNSSHCDRSTDIYSPVAQSSPDAYSCVCVCLCVCVCVCAWVCYNAKSKSGNSSFLSRLHLTKSGSSVKNAAEHLTLGGCYDNQKSLETHKQTAWTAQRLLKSPRPRILRALARIQHVSSHVCVHTHPPTQHIHKKTSVTVRDRWVISSAGHLDLEFNDFQGMVW